jgi:hypothetical protein
MREQSVVVSQIGGSRAIYLKTGREKGGVLHEYELHGEVFDVVQFRIHPNLDGLCTIFLRIRTIAMLVA